MFFDGWFDLLRLLVVGICAYIGLVLLLRVTGKRTLSKMNAFDLVVTVALGSTLASALLSSDVSLSEGLLAFALLCTLQYAVAFVSVRSERFRRVTRSEPTLLFSRGHFLPATMRQERVTQQEVVAAARAHGMADLSGVLAVVLETDGSVSVIGASNGKSVDTLRHVQGPDGTPAGSARPSASPPPG